MGPQIRHTRCEIPVSEVTAFLVIILGMARKVTITVFIAVDVNESKQAASNALSLNEASKGISIVTTYEIWIIVSKKEGDKSLTHMER